MTDLARAYGIEVPKDGTTAQMLPAMINAEQAGVFKGKPLSPYHLEKAARDRDKVPQPLSLPDPDLVKAPGPYRPASEMDIKELRQRVKKAGASPFQMTREKMEEIVESSNQ